MTVKSVADLKAGMILIADLKTPDGRLVLPSGTALTDVHLERIERMGIQGADVEEMERDVNDPSLLLEAAEYVNRFFLYVNHAHPAIRKLYELSVMRAVKRMATGWNPPSIADFQLVNVEHLHDLFFRDEGSAEEVVEHEVELASFPDIFFRIKKVLDDPDSSAQDVARVVSTDTSLSAKLLKLVNSPLYGFPSTVDTIPRAVTLVGGNELSTLASGVSAISYFKDIPPELITMKVFWKHSVTCGILARFLASKIPALDVERFFVAGLLHDIGRLILFKKLPYAASQAIIYSRENFVPLVEAEKDVMGLDHTHVGSLMLKEWKFPESLEQIISNHHNPMQADSPVEAAILHVADVVTVTMEVATEGKFIVPELDEDAWALLNLSEDVLTEALQYCDDQTKEIMSAFFGEGE